MIFISKHFFYLLDYEHNFLCSNNNLAHFLHLYIFFLNWNLLLLLINVNIYWNSYMKKNGVCCIYNFSIHSKKLAFLTVFPSIFYHSSFSKKRHLYFPDFSPFKLSFVKEEKDIINCIWFWNEDIIKMRFL